MKSENPKTKVRFKIEIACPNCQNGQVKAKPSSVFATLKCSDCDGTGFIQDYIYGELQLGGNK